MVQATTKNVTDELMLWPDESGRVISLAGIPTLPVLPVLPPGGKQAHVFAVRLAVSPPELEALSAVLDRSEIQHVRRFHFERDRHRYITGRGALRTILGHYVGISPNEVGFICGGCGKPGLAEPFAATGLQFNLAHSDDLALIAVVRGVAVGVDLERIRVLEDADELAARFFSVSENAAFAALSAEQKPAAFFNLWTRKEAWLKATGEGIASWLNRVEVTFLPGEPARLLSVPGHLGQASSWELHHLVPARDFAGALAIRAQGAQVGYWEWTGV